jgi:hypothetical protein
LDKERHHARTHVRKSGHRFTLNVRRKPKPSAQRVRTSLTLMRLSSYLPFGQSEDEEPPAKMTKLAIVEEREEDKYDHVTTIKCWTCDPENGIIVPDSPNVCYFFLKIISKLTKRVDAITCQWSDAGNVFGASVRGQSLGRRDSPLRAYADVRAICLSSHTRFW